MTPPADDFQAQFARRWGHLRHARVRALAWLLDAPNLLDAHDPSWRGLVLPHAPVTPAVARWLLALDADPSTLDAALGERTWTRLGLYAEKLMAFYFQAQGRLVAHGLQVRASRNDTVGEFDFLVDARPAGVTHIEFATKFYLLQPAAPDDCADRADLDALVGPNLADSLGAKMRKIVERQLVLGRHPAAQAVLPQPVATAQALVKGWLFYPHGQAAGPPRRGVDPAHCRGFWCAIDDIAALPDCPYVVLPKLAWLAPYRSGRDADEDAGVTTRAGLHARLTAQFATHPAPVLVALLREEAGAVLECARGFIVPAGWREQAALSACARR